MIQEVPQNPEPNGSGSDLRSLAKSCLHFEQECLKFLDLTSRGKWNEGLANFTPHIPFLKNPACPLGPEEKLEVYRRLCEAQISNHLFEDAWNSSVDGLALFKNAPSSMKIYNHLIISLSMALSGMDKPDLATQVVMDRLHQVSEETNPDRKQIGTLQLRLARNFEELALPELAARWYKAAIENLERTNDSTVFRPLLRFASFQFQRDELRDAELLLGKALRVANRHFGPHDEQTLGTRNGLAHCKLYNKKFTEALELLEISRSSPELENPQHIILRAQTLSLYAIAQQLKQNYHGAEANFRRALKIEQMIKVGAERTSARNVLGQVANYYLQHEERSNYAALVKLAQQTASH